MTTYDTELARLSVERNEAYEILYDIEVFAKGLTNGDHASIGNHLLTILYGETDV